MGKVLVKNKIKIFFQNFKEFVFEYRKIFFGILFFIFFCLISYGIWFELSHVREEVFVFTNVRTVATKQIIAGMPVKLVALVDANEIKNGKKFVRIPRVATDITIKKVTPEEIRAIKENQQLQITPEQKSNLVKSIKIVAKAGISKSLLGSVSQNLNFLLSDGEQAVENVASVVAPDVNSQLVDISSAVISTPTITSISPATGTDAGGDVVTITGTEFAAGATVTIGGASATVASVSSDGTTIMAATPAGTDGVSDVVVNNTDNGTVTLSGGFTYVAPSQSLTETTSPSDLSPVETPAPQEQAPQPLPIVETLPSEVGATPGITPNPAIAGSNDQAQPQQPPCQGDATDNCIAITYTLPAPIITQQTTDTGQLVTVSAPTETPDQPPLTDVVAFTTIPKIFKVGEESKIHIKWKNNGNQDVTFHAEDTDGDGYLDYVEWTVPHLSDQEFEIIFISKAFQLDSDQNITADIYDTVSTQDGNYATVPQNNYVRTTFYQTLDNTKDITIYARPTAVGTSPEPVEGQALSIQVYPVYTDSNGNQTEGAQLQTVSDGINPDFSNIDHDGKYRILLQNLQTPTDVFDLKVTGPSTDSGQNQSAIDFDYIVDPPWLTGWTNREQITISHTNVGSADLSYFPLLVSMAETGGSSTNIGYNLSDKTNGDDIRFVKSDGTTLLSFERESFSDTSNNLVANFWVKVPTISHTADTTIYIYYTNASATTDWSTIAGNDADQTNCATPKTPAQCTWKEGSAQNYAGVWHLKETGTVTTWANSTSNVDDGTNNGVTATTGQIDGAGIFAAASNQYINLPTGSSAYLATAFTFSAWVKATNNSNIKTVIRTANSSPAADTALVVNWTSLDAAAANKATIGAYNGGWAGHYLIGTTNVNNGAWHLITGQYTGTQYKLFVDGISDATPLTSSGPATNASQAWMIGRYPLSSAEYMDGSLDEVEISSTARLADWIKFEYYNQKDANGGVFGSGQDQLTFGTQSGSTGTLYWVGGAGNWSDATNHWASSSGGTPAAGNLPATGDSVVFDSNSCSSACAIAIDSSVTVANFTDSSTNATITASGTVTATGNMTISNGIFQTAQNADGSVNVTGTLLVDTNGTFVVRYKSKTVPNSGGSGQTITAGTLTINGNMNADGQGFAASSGPGAGTSGSWIASGAGYGGPGGFENYGTNYSAGGSDYGTAASPTSLGSGGGSSNGGIGGAGGGAIKISVSGTLTVNGTFSANGAMGGGSGTYAGSGGGSGGSIWITGACTLVGTGTISVNGSSYNTALANAQGGGGGGRIDISGITVSGSTFLTGGGNLSVIGGAGDPGGAGKGDSGRAGTIKFPSSFDLVIDNSGVAGLKNLTLGVNVESGAVDETLYTFNSITIDASSTLTLSGNPQIINGGTSGNPYGQGVTITATNITLATSTSTISADGQGFIGGSSYTTNMNLGPGAGIIDASSNISGSGYGGDGGSAGSAAGGSTYGSLTSPTALGSGDTGPYTGGNGGGGIKLVASGTLTDNGTISANGTGISNHAGGVGSGGSIYISVGILAGSGTIAANGKSALADWVYGGGGGGGRVAIYYTTSCSITPTAYGGSKTGTAQPGAAGTVYIQSTAQGASNGDLTINNNNTATTAVTEISSSVTGTTVGTITLTASKAGQLTVDSGQTLTTQGTGTLTIGTGTTLTNNGTLNVAGSFANSGTFTSGSPSTVTLTGTTQTISGSNTFYNLTINGVGQTTTLGGNLIVSNTLSITSGTLAVGSNNLTVSTTLSNSGLVTVSTGTISIPNASSGNFTFTGANNIPAATYSTLIINASGHTDKLGGAITVTNLTITAGILDVASPLDGTGGLVTHDGLYTVNTFNSSGTFTPPAGVSSVAVLVVGGGGGGGSRTAGGGGGGGLIYNSSFPISTQSYSVTIGAGGAGGVSNGSGNYGTNGGNSIFSTQTAVGGGGGGCIGHAKPATGGSGGGAGDSESGGSAIGGDGTAGQGNNGGTGYQAASYSGGGGGGAGAVGTNAVSGGAGNGGIGLTCSMSGVSTYYAGGGGGGTAYGVAGTGGTGGGASGSSGGGVGLTATANTGGGGGGNGYTANTGGAGGSGVVIIRYLTPPGSSSNIILGGNWTNSVGAAGFNAESGTVTFNGTNQTISGSTTFYNLTKSVSSADTLTFTAGTTQTISNVLTLNGASGQLLSLRSSSTGNQWNINPQSTRTISYLDVKDSDNTNATAIPTTGLNITNSGNNTNWTFNVLPIASVVSINSNASAVILNPGGTQNVSCAATVADGDGYSDIVSIAAVFYRTGVTGGAGAGDNNANHYTLSGTTAGNCTGCSGTTCTTCTFTFPVNYNADPTDSGTYSADNWTCQVTPTDHVGAGTAATSTIEIDSLQAISVDPTISFSGMNPGAKSIGTHKITITNAGNVSTQFEVKGGALACTRSAVPVGNQKYALSGFTYDTGGTSLTTSYVIVPSSATPVLGSTDVYWQIYVPNGTSGTCTGSEAFNIY